MRRSKSAGQSHTGYFGRARSHWIKIESLLSVFFVTIVRHLLGVAARGMERMQRLRMRRLGGLVVLLLAAAALPYSVCAQQSTPATAPAKPRPKPEAKPDAKPDSAASKPAAPAAAKPASPAAVAGGAQPKLLGQYGIWGAYTASPSGKKICFVLAKPASSETSPPNRPRNPVYMFISTRPADKVTNEVSLVVGYPFKAGFEANAQIGATSFPLYTQQDGAWIKNAAEEAKMVEAMRGGDTAVVKGMSAKGTQSTDTFTLKGVSQALDRAGQECK
jgi:Invasion associated locus B (IalB) protein